MNGALRTDCASCLSRTARNDRTWRQTTPWTPVITRAPTGKSAIDEPLQVLGVAGALHIDFRGCTIDIAKVRGGQLDPDGAEILLQPVALRRSRNGNDPRLLRQ